MTSTVKGLIKYRPAFIVGKGFINNNGGNQKRIVPQIESKGQ